MSCCYYCSGIQPKTMQAKLPRGNSLLGEYKSRIFPGSLEPTFPATGRLKYRRCRLEHTTLRNRVL